MKAPWLCSFSLLLAVSVSAQTIPEKSVSEKKAEADQAETVTLNVFEVKAEGEKGYGVSTSSSATRLAMPLKDIPQSINVVTAAFLEDAFAFDLGDAMRYVPNVAKRSPTLPFQVFVRGFVVQNIYQDGFRLAGDSANTQTGGDPASLSRIEVIKGPASAISGRGEVGGAVNFITKRPERKQQSEVTTTVGTYDFYRVVADSTGPLNADGSLRYRMIGVWQDSTRFKMFEKIRKLAFFPSIEWDWTAKTQFRLTATMGNFLAPGSGGQNSYFSPRTPGSNPTLPPIFSPRDANWGGESWERKDDSTNWWLLTAVHRFNDVFTLRQGVQLSNTTALNNWVEPSPALTLDPTGNILRSRQYRENKINLDQYYIQGDLVAKYDFLNTSHLSLLAYDYGKQKTDGTFILGTLTPFNITRPVYGAAPTAVFVDNANVLKQQTAGFAGQHQVSLLSDRIKLMAGIRFDSLQSLQAYSVRTAGPLRIKRNWGAYTGSPRYGVTVSPTKSISVYAVSSEDKQPSVTINRFSSLPASDPRSTQTLTAARDGKMVEFGVKGELLSGRLSVSVAAFDQTRKGQQLVITRAGENGVPYNEFFFSAGERAKGYEAEVFGSITDRLEVVASYSNTKTSSTLQGATVRMMGVPRYNYRAFVSYRFHDLRQDGFSVRAGFVKFGEMWGTSDNLLRIAPQSHADAGVGYSWKRYRFDLQVNNVFDDYFIESMPFAIGVNYIQPRQVFASWRVKW